MADESIAGVETPARRRLESRLDELVRGNRFTIAVLFPLAGAVLLVASAQGRLPPALSFNPWLVLFGTLVMRLPLLAGVAPVVDRRAGAALAILTAYAYAVEYLGATTGIPYGSFSYGVALGPMVGGAVPLGLPLFFVPLVLDASLLALLSADRAGAGRAVRVALAVAIVLAVDLVLDPGAVALGFWEYAAGGPYYGVPWTNFAGWLLSATVAVGLLEWGLDRAALQVRLRSCEFALDDLVSFVCLWGSIAAIYAAPIPLAIAVGILYALVRTERVDPGVLAALPSVVDRWRGS
ncbi:MAG: bisanhydrobacterioruberin hydratase [Haloarculaceae archaeon]